MFFEPQSGQFLKRQRLHIVADYLVSSTFQRVFKIAMISVCNVLDWPCVRTRLRVLPRTRYCEELKKKGSSFA